MKKVIFGALLTLGVVVFVGCADKAAEKTVEKPAATKCGGSEAKKCGAATPVTKCGAEANTSKKCGSETNQTKKCGAEANTSMKCGAENNGKCGAQK